MLSLDQIVADFNAKIEKEEDSKEKVKKIIEFGTEYFDTIGHRCASLLDQAIAISIKINYPGGEAISLLNRTFLRSISKDINEMDPDIDRVKSLLDEIRDQPYEYGYSLSMLAYNHWYKGEFDKGFDLIFESLKFSDRLNNDKTVGWTHYAIGVFYFDTKDYTNSESHYKKAEEVFEKNNYKYGMARAMNGIASVKIKNNKTSEAVPHLETAIEYYREGSHYSGLGRALTDLALIEKANNRLQRALEIFIDSLKIREEIKHTQGLITTHTEIAEVYTALNDPENAMVHLKAGLDLSESIKAKYKSIRLHKLISDAYKRSGNIGLAFEHFEKFHNLKEEILSEESANNIRNMQTKYERDRSEKEAEIERLKTVELKNAYDMISDQKMILEEKQKEVLDSIHYAKRIQQSLLPTEKYIEKNLARLKNSKK